MPAIRLRPDDDLAGAGARPGCAVGRPDGVDLGLEAGGAGGLTAAGEAGSRRAGSGWLVVGHRL